MPGDPQDGDAAGIQPPVPELEALARLLSDSRQTQGLSVVDLAQRLHMGVEQLKALERGDQQHLPEPVFVIAQARRVADALGVEISAQIEALRSSEPFMAGRPALRSEVFQTAVGRQRGAEGSQAKPAVQPQPATNPAPNPPQQHPPKSNPRTSDRQRNSARQTSAQAGRTLAWLLVLSGVVAAGSWAWQHRQGAQPALASALQRWSQWVDASRRAVSPPPQTKPQAPTAAVIRPVELLISARQPSWLEVRPAAGGQPLFLGTFIGERRFPLAAGLSLRAGRPDLVRVAVGSAPPKPLGTISDIRWVSFKAPAQDKPAVVPTQAPPGQPTAAAQRPRPQAGIKPPAQPPLAAPQS